MNFENGGDVNPMESIADELKTVWLGHHYDYMDSVSSTNTICYELAEKGAPSGFVLCADSQTAGRGRRGNHWESPKGGLWFSVLLRPSCTLQEAQALTLVTAVGLCRGLMYYPGLRAGIKWPNDIYSGGRKLCGILSELKPGETCPEYVVIGIGINLSTAGLTDRIVSEAAGMEDILCDSVDKRELLCRLLLGLESAYDQYISGQKERLFEEWKNHALLLGVPVVVETPGGELRGVPMGLTDDGFLLLDMGNGKGAKVIAGHLRPQNPDDLNN